MIDVNSDSGGPIPLSVPVVADRAWSYVKECLETGWISSAGSYVARFEQAICDLTGSKFAVATVNGSAALHIAMLVGGVKPGDGVLTANLTFVATVNAIRYANAQPVLVDVRPDTWQMDLDLVEEYLANECERVDRGMRTPEGLVITTVVPVHVLGNMCDMPRLLALAERFGLLVVEDSTEALGSTQAGINAGCHGLLGTCSFNGNKILSTGGGGMVLTQREDLARRAKHLTTQAKTEPAEYFHDEVGYNYRLVNVLAAIGVAQAAGFTETLKRRRTTDANYRQALKGVGDVEFAESLPDVQPNGWLTTFKTARLRELLAVMNAQRIECRPLWVPMNRLPMYSNTNYLSHRAVSDSLYAQCISIPSSSDLTESQQQRVIDTIRIFYTADR